MGLADAEKIPFVAIIGDDEMKNGTVALKDMSSGEQRTVTPQELVEILK